VVVRGEPSLRPEQSEASGSNSGSDDNSDSEVVPEGGEVLPGRLCMDAQWVDLEEERADGSRTYGLPSGELFSLPLDTCLFCDVDSHIAYNRTNFHITVDGVQILNAEVARVSK
jgi:hypothetical protein